MNIHVIVGLDNKMFVVIHLSLCADLIGVSPRIVES